MIVHYYISAKLFPTHSKIFKNSQHKCLSFDSSRHHWSCTVFLTAVQILEHTFVKVISTYTKLLYKSTKNKNS